MISDDPRIIRDAIALAEVHELAQRRFGDMVKASVDIYRADVRDGWIEFIR